MKKAPKPLDFYFTHFGLSVAPFASDEELWAVGLVVTLWNHIESAAAVMGNALTAYDRDSRLQFHAAQTMDNRLRLLRSIIKLKVVPAHVPTMLKFVDRIGSMLAQRDRIIHGAWSFRLTEAGVASDLDTQDHFLINATPYGKIFKWNLNYERIFKVARQMDRLVLDINDFQHLLFDDINDRPSAFSHDSWRHILKEQGPRLPIPDLMRVSAQSTRRKRGRQPKP